MTDIQKAIEIDGGLIVGYVWELRMAKGSAAAICWLEKIDEMTKAMRWYIRRDRLKGEGKADG